MGKSGNADQLRHGGRPGVIQHADDEFGAELRYAQGADINTAVLLCCDPQRLRTGKEFHDIRIVQRDLRGVEARQVLQHTDHGRIVVSQNIELEQVVVDRMIVKVGRDDVGRHIIGRVLHGSKGIDIFPQRKDDDAARMLAGTPPDACTACKQTFDLTVSLGDPFIFKIMLDVAVGGLVRHGRYGSGLEGLLMAENNLGIGVGFGLVFP